ncbi:putative type I restriction-modification system specificity subunit [Amphibacillus xylanus NBRC 15112]|uniref:Putative type I restriction-modification system specificity subunit n=2 Tax=Amphibacillus xylanus TaxID=1449 RepID=K0IWW0_AMPXN|nr:putative type I restriction-modification system specificity subunit [Amphibacillus xylanus NBRC 15112]
MKDSGIEWIGEIPEDWEVSKIGSHYIERTDKVSDLDFEPLSVTKNGIVPQLETAAKSSNHNNRKLVLKNDFVINSRSDRKMSAGISSMDGSVSVINTVLYSYTIDRDYTKYLLKNYAFAEEFYRWGTGIVDDLWSTKWLKMKNISIPVPPNDKQKQIGQTLDRLTQNTNNIITQTQQSIEELKKYKQSLITEAVTKGLDPNVEMKDSGIEWIGKIPKHWSVRKISNYFSQVKDKNDELEEENLLSLSYGSIIRRNINSTDGLLPANFKNYNIVESGDIVLRMTDLQNDKVSLRTGFVTEKGIITSAYITIRTDHKNVILPKYIRLYLHSFDIYKGFYGMGSGVRQNVTYNDIKKIEVIVPSINEQRQIVSYLDEQTSRIDKLIEDKTKIIEELEDYKKSLIYEYVTGKKEV